LVAQLTGSADRASYTTGPATRRALAQAGALGATTGTVVHLSAAPGADPAQLPVLAHELAHARHPISRPRFLLHNPSGALDADERAAQSAGANAVSPAPVVQRLGGLPGVRGAVASAGASGLAQQAGSTVDAVRNQAAGIVDRLPVGGAGMSGMADVAAQAARDAVADRVPDNVASALQEVSAAGDGAVAALTGGSLSTMAGQVGGSLGTAADQAGQWVNSAAAGAGDAAAGVAGAVNQAAGVANQAAGALAGLTGPDLDKLTQAIEERLLRQLERRGGRYAGVF
jgi:hypothetical protein